jgi:microcystin-dependent protein
MGTPFMAEVKIVSFNFAPKGWALCNGQTLPINQNQALFALLGTTYGGDGRTTFALPNFRGRVPMHQSGGYTLGQAGGETAHTVTTSEMPTHLHTVTADTTTAPASGGNVPNATKRLAASAGTNLYGGPANLVAMNAGVVPAVGGSQPHDNMSPYLVLNFVIALQGIFPSQA